MCVEVCEVLFKCVKSCPVCASRIRVMMWAYLGLSVCFWCVSVLVGYVNVSLRCDNVGILVCWWCVSVSCRDMPMLHWDV